MNKSDKRNILSYNLERLLSEKNISRRTIANELGYTYNRMCDWTKGRTSPRLSDIKRIADYLEVKPDALLLEPETDYLGANDTLYLRNKTKVYILNTSGNKNEKRFIDLEYISSKYTNPGNSYNGWIVWDNQMEPKYSIGDTVIGKYIEKRITDHDGDYLLCDKNGKFYFKRILISDGDKYLVYSYNLDDKKTDPAELLTESEIFNKYTNIHRAIAIYKYIK